MHGCCHGLQWLTELSGVCTVLHHVFSLDYFLRRFTGRLAGRQQEDSPEDDRKTRRKTTGRLAHTIFQGSCSVSVMGQTSCQWAECQEPLFVSDPFPAARSHNCVKADESFISRQTASEHEQQSWEHQTRAGPWKGNQLSTPATDTEAKT